MKMNGCGHSLLYQKKQEKKWKRQFPPTKDAVT
jgi:hypothetical protein